MMNQKDFFANSPKKSRMIILNQTFNFHRKKHCTGKFSEVFFKKNISKFLEYSKKSFRCGERFSWPCTCNVDVIALSNG